MNILPSTKELTAYINLPEVQRVINANIDFSKEIDPLKEAYEKLNIGKFTNEVFTSIKENKGQNECNAYLQSVYAEFDKLGIKNEVTRKTIADGHKPTLNEWLEVVNTIFDKQDYKYKNLNYLNYNTNFFVSEESKEKIKESNSLILKNPNEIKLYNKLQEIQKMLSETREAFNDALGYKLADHSKTNYIIEKYFIKESNSKIEFTPQGFKEFRNDYKLKG